MWIVKLDSTGEYNGINYGARNSDVCNAIRLATDGGYFIGGATNSGLSGDKTDTCRGDADMWIIKLTNTGQIEWQTSLGGNKWEFPGALALTSVEELLYADILRLILQVTNQKLTGVSVPIFGVIQLDKNGKTIWDKTLGSDNDDMALGITKPMTDII